MYSAVLINLVRNLFFILFFISLCRYIACYYESEDKTGYFGKFCSIFEHNNTCCYRREFQCEDGTCIPLNKVCETSNFNKSHDYEWEFARRKYKIDCYSPIDEIGCEDNPCTARDKLCDHTCLDIPHTNKSKCICFHGYHINQNLNHQNRYLCEDINECEIGVHSCIHSCLNLNGSFTCSCSKGFKKNNELCKAEDKNTSIFYTSNNCIYMYFLNSEVSKKIICADNLYGMDYDPVTDILYWSDDYGVSRSYIPGAKQGNITVIHPQRLPYTYNKESCVKYSLAIDWQLENMYWKEPNPLDKKMSNIFVSKLDGRYTKTMVSLPRLSDFTLDLENSDLFVAFKTIFNSVIWSKWMITYSVGKAIIQIPQGDVAVIAYDHLSNGRIYWGDPVRMAIYYVFRNGKRPTKVIQTGPERFPLSLDIFEEYIYWVTKSTGELLRVYKLGGGNIEILVKDLINPSLIKIYHKDKYLDGFKRKRVPHCDHCQHLCFSTSFSDLCACSDGTADSFNNGEVICLNPQQEPSDDPLECNCNDIAMVCNQTLPYSNCSCPDSCHHNLSFPLSNNGQVTENNKFELAQHYKLMLALSVTSVLICCFLSFLKKYLCV